MDESLYSRQLYVLGKAAMLLMQESRILVHGVGSLGVEISKNLILAGVKSVSLFDRRIVTKGGLGGGFMMTEEDVGREYGDANVEGLGGLNSYVDVKVVHEVNVELYQVVVLTESTFSERVLLGKECRAKGVKFVCGESHGLFGFAFNDFQRGFEVIDTNGEVAKRGLISKVSADGVVSTLEDVRHGLEDGDSVSFGEIEGMDGVAKVTTLSPFSFKVSGFDTSKYEGGGFFQQVKVVEKVDFDEFEVAWAKGDFVVSDYAKFDRMPLLHVCFKALGDFQGKFGRLPLPMKVEDGETFVALFKKAMEVFDAGRVVSDEELKIVLTFAYQSFGDVPAMSAVLGGMIAQEVLKGCSGKFMPIKQFLYFDSLESLPKATLTEQDVCSLGPGLERYDRQTLVFGKKFMFEMFQQHQFLVGSGAIGCELLKLWAMMGLGIKGKVYVTDMDTIEKSNLNRQFLFRSSDVGKLKSQCAVEKVKRMNPNCSNYIAFSDRVGPETELIFNQDFFESLTGVTNALDNVDARKYMDQRCVFYSKPLLESGTLGTKGNTQVILPHLTESYSSSNDPPEQSIPICTLKNFPNQIEHTIQWSRDLFEGIFVQPLENVNLYLTHGIDAVVKQSGNSEVLSEIKSYLVTHKPVTLDDCVVWARLKFEDLFTSSIRQLLINFPVDSYTSTGGLFWTGAKRAPVVTVFDVDDQDHLDFIVSTCNLHARNYGFKGSNDRKYFVKVLDSVIVPDFVPLVSKTDEAVKDEVSLPHSAVFAGIRLEPSVFEKDDDEHIDFITSASNLRARNYRIDTADKLKTKFIAGKIIPAIATTTSLVAGLVCLELMKLVDGKRNLEDYKNGFINLALPFMAFGEPVPCLKYKYHDKTWTLWDRFEITAPMTLQQLLDHFLNDHQLTITMMSSGAVMLYSFFMPKKKLQERLGMTVREILKSILKKEGSDMSGGVLLEVCVNDKDGEDVEVPPILLKGV